MSFPRLPGIALLGAALTLSCAAPQTEVRPTRAATGRSDDPWLLGERCTAETPTDPAPRIEVLAAGSGEPVEPGATVRIHYVAGLATGVVLHDSHEGNNTPSEIIIGSTKTICGFERALAGMRPGERRRVIVPWSLGFGETGRPPEIPPRADLAFLIDLYLPADVVIEQHSGPANPGAARRRR